MDPTQQNAKPTPPPYTLEIEDSPQGFLTRLVDFENLQQSDHAPTPFSSTQEVERIRGFLTFALTMDYQNNTNASLSAPDRDHFTSMANVLHLFTRASQNTEVLPSEKQQYATYFWKYLWEPCKILEIPAESVLVCIQRMLRYSQPYTGGYGHGCCDSVLRDYGLDGLAAKIYLDQRILIPRIIEDSGERHRMHAAVSEVRAKYFTRIYGIEGATPSTSFGTTREEWVKLQTVVYDATEEGRRLKKHREEFTQAAKGQMSVRYWLEKVRRMIEGVRKRGQEEKGTASSSHKSSNGGRALKKEAGNRALGARLMSTSSVNGPRLET